MIAKIKIRNFRCFANFSLNDVKPINLFTGANGVGKSTLLESLFLLIDRNNGLVFTKLNGFRGIPYMFPAPSTQWEYLFTNKKTNEPIEISVMYNQQSECIKMVRDFESHVFNITDIKSNQNIPWAGTAYNYPLKVTYTAGEKEEQFHFILSDKGEMYQIPQKISDSRNIYYIKNINSLAPIQWFTQIEDVGLKHELINYLRVLDSRVMDISLAVKTDATDIHVDLGLSARLPVQVMGDGINKLLVILLCMIANPSCILLLDEIENGFHYSHMHKIWEIIATVTKEKKCQIFATTHSYECIEAVQAINNEDSKSFISMFQLVRLERENDKITPVVLNGESLSFALNQNWEVR
jgi:AAA15 family ATPase/GTPase